MAERMCLVSYSRASGATEWNVASVCATSPGARGDSTQSGG